MIDDRIGWWFYWSSLLQNHPFKRLNFILEVHPCMIKGTDEALYSQNYKAALTLNVSLLASLLASLLSSQYQLQTELFNSMPKDDVRSLMDWIKKDAMIFKGLVFLGSNLTILRLAIA